jgi:CRP-like cAMP-binding protein
MAMHHGAAKRIPFFKGRDAVFVANVVPFLQHLFVTENEIIYEENEYADEIYFITKGRISYVHGADNYVYKYL